jgi:hypothetical protein
MNWIKTWDLDYECNPADKFEQEVMAELHKRNKEFVYKVKVLDGLFKVRLCKS